MSWKSLDIEYGGQIYVYLANTEHCIFTVRYNYHDLSLPIVYVLVCWIVLDKLLSSADNCLKNTDGKWCQDNWQTEHWEIPDPGTDCGAQGQDNLPGGTGREKHQKSRIVVTVLCCLITLQGGHSSLLFQKLKMNESFPYASKGVQSWFIFW